VNFPTTRCSIPAAAPQTGRGERALPPAGRGAKTQSLPFAALPHDLRKDPRLKGNRTAIVLAAALLEYAPGVKSSCYPTNTRLAADLGCCEQTIRTALAALQAAGWIKIVRGSNQPNGRRIWLTWRMDGCTVPALRQVLDTPQPVGPLPQPVGGPLKPIGPEEEIVIEEGIEEESRQFARAIERPRGEPKPAPTAAPAQPPASERAAEPALVPPPLAPPAPVQALPPSAEVGLREARPAILQAPAGPTSPSAPGPVPGGVATPAEVDPRQSLASLPPALRLARSQSIPSSELDPPALVAAPEPRPGLARVPRVEPPRSAPVPAPSPAKAGPAPVLWVNPAPGWLAVSANFTPGWIPRPLSPPRTPSVRLILPRGWNRPDWPRCPPCRPGRPVPTWS
jgi:helix-turn-helix protein